MAEQSREQAASRSIRALAVDDSERALLARSAVASAHAEVFTSRDHELVWSAAGRTYSCEYGRSLRILTNPAFDHLEIETLALPATAAIRHRDHLEETLVSAMSELEALGVRVLRVKVGSREVRVAISAAAYERREHRLEVLAEREGVALEGLGSTTFDLTLHPRFRAPAEPPSSIRARIVLDPQPAGVFFHELVGHGTERGAAGEPPLLASGAIIGPRELRVVDDPTLEGRGGSFLFDDEGTRASPRTLVDGGIVVGELADLRSSRLSGGGIAGNARRESFRDAPLPRMSNLVVAPGTSGWAAPDHNASIRVTRVETATLSGDGTHVRLSHAAATRDGQPTGFRAITIARSDLARAELGVRAELVASARCGRFGATVPVSVESPALLIDAELET